MDEGSVPKHKDDSHIHSDIRSFLRNEATHLFYAFHWYGPPIYPSLNASIANAKSLSALWKAPAVLTEYNFEGDETSENRLEQADVHRTCTTVIVQCPQTIALLACHALLAHALLKPVAQVSFRVTSYDDIKDDRLSL